MIAWSSLSRGGNENENYLLVMFCDWSQPTMATWPIVQTGFSSCFWDTTPSIHSLFMADLMLPWEHCILPIILKYLLSSPLEKTFGSPNSNELFQTCTHLVSNTTTPILNTLPINLCGFTLMDYVSNCQLVKVSYLYPYCPDNIFATRKKVRQLSLGFMKS